MSNNTEFKEFEVKATRDLYRCGDYKPSIVKGKTYTVIGETIKSYILKGISGNASKSVFKNYKL